MISGAPFIMTIEKPASMGMKSQPSLGRFPALKGFERELGPHHPVIGSVKLGTK